MTYIQTFDYDASRDLHLGRNIEHDPRSLDFVIKPSIAQRVKRLIAQKDILWPRYSYILNQGQLGSCTGNAITGLLACAPFCKSNREAAKFNEKYAVDIYSKATIIDGFPGEYPPEDTGSSGLAVAKVAKSLGLISSYQWATTTNGLLTALQQGPVIVGIPWYSGFDTPDNEGTVHLSGSLEGGHEFLIRGYSPKRKLLFCDNSWGRYWGINGTFSITFADWESLRKQKADVTIPIK